MKGSPWELKKKIFPTLFPNQTLSNFFLLKSIKPFNFYLSVKRIGPRIREGNERRDRLSTLVQKVFLEIFLRDCVMMMMMSFI